MYLSNRLTYSVASLVVMLVIGLAFAPIYVLAHPHGDSVPNADGHLESDHPTATITLTSANADTFTDASIKNNSVQLVKTDGTGFAVTSGTDPPLDSDGKFKLLITFDKDLADDAELLVNEYAITAIGQSDPNTDIGGDLEKGGPSRVTDSKRAFEVEITVLQAQFEELPLIVFVTVDPDAVSTPEGIDPQTGETIAPRGSLESSRADARFEVVADLRTVPESTEPLPDGTITIPANSFVLVVRNDDASQPGAGGLHFRSDVNTVEWQNMPDLEELFSRTSEHGGGALVLEGTGLTVGSVGISEIMWALDESYFGNEVAESASQWIELHNLNSSEVNVTLKVLRGLETLETANGITGDLAVPIIDAVTNFFDNRPGFAAWTVKGSSGDSVQARNFVSMGRILPVVDNKNVAYANANGSRYSNRDGRNDSNWSASTTTYRTARTSGNIDFDYIGTPGRVNTFTPATQPHLKDTRTSVPSNGILINEVANRSDANKQYEWLELYNISSSEINLRNYRVSMVTAVDTDQALLDFPTNDNAKVASGGVLLIVASDPADDQDHPLAVGYNVDKSDAGQAPGALNSPVQYKVMEFKNGGLPDGGEFVLIVRKPDNLEDKSEAGKGPAELGIADLDKIVDIAGYHSDLDKSNYSNPVSSTELWPLRNFKPPFTTLNRFDTDTVHYRQFAETNDGRSGVGASENKNEAGKAAFQGAGFTGIGYKRSITGGNAYGGTPGYVNSALKSKDAVITDHVYISEIMYADGANGSLPQWIELRNPSKTVGADLNNWRLTIVNHDSTDDEGGLWEGKGEASIQLKDLKIKPNSSVLITSRKGPQREVFLPNADIFALYPTHRNTFGMTTPGDDVINPYGFKITLHANAHDTNKKSEWQLVEEIGNLAAPESDRRGNRERFDPVSWSWPQANTEDGDRISVARVIHRDGPVDGSMIGAWRLSSDDTRTNAIDYVYYGHKDDISTPGQTYRSPLPVNLSFFRPTLEDGKVVIRWTTESELDNAGFNILRSDTRNGKFQQVNGKLIQGKGTTGERSIYKWIDTSAKLGTIYYYQIEDISFAGERQTLQTTKLKGLISAKNKLPLRWGELKSQD